METPKPHFNPKFRQFEITWTNPDGSYGGAWGDTKEECVKNFNKTNKEYGFQQGLQRNDT